MGRFGFTFKFGEIVETKYNNNFYDEANHLIHINCLYRVKKTNTQTSWGINFDNEKVVKAILDKYDIHGGNYSNSNDQQIGYISCLYGSYQNPTNTSGPILKYLMYAPTSWKSCGFGGVPSWNIDDIKYVYIFGLIGV